MAVALFIAFWSTTAAAYPWMLKHGYEGLAEHRTEHEDLIASVQALQQRLHDQGKPVLGDQIAFLEHWLTGHIFGADMKMGAYLGEMM